MTGRPWCLDSSYRTSVVRRVVGVQMYPRVTSMTPTLFVFGCTSVTVEKDFLKSTISVFGTGVVERPPRPRRTGRRPTTYFDVEPSIVLGSSHLVLRSLWSEFRTDSTHPNPRQPVSTLDGRVSKEGGRVGVPFGRLVVGL